MNYSEKLKDPRWQKKRLEIMQRDNFKCAYCEDPETTLSVHHLIYLKNADPWDYPNNLLYTLCPNCHELIKDVDFAGELVKYILDKPNPKFLKMIIDDPIKWVINFANNGYSSFKEYYKEYLEWYKWMEKNHKNG